MPRIEPQTEIGAGRQGGLVLLKGVELQQISTKKLMKRPLLARLEV